MKIHKTRAKRVVYPTGYTTRRQEYSNASGTLKIQLEQVLSYGRSLGVGAPPIGGWEVGGSMIPKGASGALCHETLPDGTFRRESDARAFADKMFRLFAPQAKGGAR
jgi:hypothetical protein